MATKKRPLTMRISLTALEHLGMNLYSNIPAVLSEIVANSWDADAESVKVSIDKENETITIEDDGIGMDRDDVIDYFLTVGFKRRSAIGELTPLKKRKPMGRKGIGKLSSFSIARVVQVFTVKDGKRTAFRMDRDDIKARISSNDSAPYEPSELTNWRKSLKIETRIVLARLSKKLSDSRRVRSEGDLCRLRYRRAALRRPGRRLARRHRDQQPPINQAGRSSVSGRARSDTRRIALHREPVERLAARRRGQAGCKCPRSVELAGGIGRRHEKEGGTLGREAKRHPFGNRHRQKGAS
jgi:Histidine kinase-, DNA gyrase B-, and HSP90-like ATPase